MLKFEDTSDQFKALAIACAFSPIGAHAWETPQTVKPEMPANILSIMDPENEFYENSSISKIIEYFDDQPASWALSFDESPTIPPQLVTLEQIKRKMVASEKVLPRLNHLRMCSLEDEEAFSDESERSLLEFLDGYGVAVRPLLALLDNGNLRAVWKDDFGQQIGVQFLGGKKVQFVLFVKRDAEMPYAQLFGRNNGK
jgi:hypothetical protein